MKKLLLLLLIASFNLNASKLNTLEFDFDDNYAGTDNPYPVALYDQNGSPISSLNGAIAIHDADVHRQAINKHIHQHTGITTTISIDTAVNDTEINVADTTGFVVGNVVDINTTSIETTHPIVLSITAGTPGILHLDRRLDVVHLIGDVVSDAVINLASQAGTLANPEIYSVGPPAGEVWHISNLTLAMGHTTAGDFGLFGNLAALTNGVVLRVKISGNYGTLTNWKTNGEINVDTGEVDFHARSGGQGTAGTAANGAFKRRTGAVIRLDGDNSDEFQVYIQDDVTTGTPDLVFWNMKVQGHIEDQ